MQKKSSSVTLADIARESGVSISTVSLVLNQKQGIPHETRLKVLSVAQARGYQPKNASVPAPTDDSDAITKIGVIVKAQIDDPIPPTSNVFYSHVLAGVESMCRRRELHLLLAVLPTDTNSYPLEIPKMIRSKLADAFLLIGVRVDESLENALKHTGAPVVLVDGNGYKFPFDEVASENYQCGYQATRYLYQQGHRHIAYVGAFEGTHPSFAHRRHGYCDALNELGIKNAYIEDCSYNNSAQVFNAISRLRQRAPEVTAVMGCNDKVGIEILQAAATLGLNVPQDLSVIGFDNITLAESVIPPLTSMEIDKVSMGRLSVEMALYRANFPDSAPVKLFLFPKLIERQSVRKLQGA